MVTSLPGARGSSRLGPAAATARAMRLGQHAIAIALTAIGVARAIGDGTELAAAIAAGAAVLAWHTAGALLPATAPRWVTYWWLVGFAAVWGAAVAVSAEFVWLAFLLWLLAGHLLPGWWALGFSVLVYAVVAVAPVLHHGATSYANIFGPLIGGVFALGISRGYLQLLHDAAERESLVESLQLARHETELLQDELALAQRQSGAMGERARIARDIHDTVAQGLSSIRLIAHAASGATPAAATSPAAGSDAGAGSTPGSIAGSTPGLDAGSDLGAATATAPDALSPVERIERLAGESLRDVRRIIAALTPAELETGALSGALERLVERFALDAAANSSPSIVGTLAAPTAAAPLNAQLHVDEALPQLPADVEVALLRVAQSALSNVRQHARASRVDVTLSAAGGGVRLDVRDDGLGFEVPRWESAIASTEGTPSFGLRLMRDRLRDLGGGLDIESEPGEGCAISAYLPLGSTGTAAQAGTAAPASPSTPKLADEPTDGATP